MGGPPLVGITGSSQLPAPPLRLPLYATNQAYAHAVREVGGFPVILPPLLTDGEVDGLLSRLDGLILSGGGDVAPETYGEAHSPLAENVDRERDRTELLLTEGALRAGLPLLGICRGVQVLDVALGGSLYLDLAAQVPGALRHRPAEGDRLDAAAHAVRLASDSLLAAILGAEEVQVVSSHHQAPRDVGRDLQVTAWAPDGVVEGLEHRAHPFCVGVQWHPEIFTEKVDRMAGLFAALVRAAGDVCASR